MEEEFYWDVRVQTGFVWTLAGCCEHHNDTLCLVKGREFFDHLGENLLHGRICFSPKIFIYVRNVCSAA
jgi:hypothetical protein